MEKLNDNTIDNLEDFHWHSQNNNELPSIQPQSSFQPDARNQNRKSVILEDAQVPQQA